MFSLLKNFTHTQTYANGMNWIFFRFSKFFLKTEVFQGADLRMQRLFRSFVIDYQFLYKILYTAGPNDKTEF